MENDKYYTPEIEEFHVGFEYEEEFHAPNWVKMIKPPKDLYEWISLKVNNFNSLSRINSKIKKNKCRVKYLDEKDIKEVGWISGESYGMSCYLLPDEEGNPILDGFQLMFHSRELIEIYQESTSDFKFSGTLKNKSELISQLKRCGIEIKKIG